MINDVLKVSQSPLKEFIILILVDAVIYIVSVFDVNNIIPILHDNKFSTVLQNEINKIFFQAQLGT